MADAPYVFARHNLQKPAHDFVRTMRVRGALCQNGCGLYYVAPTDEEMKPDDACPDCGDPPKPWRISAEPEEIDVHVFAAFGNLPDVSFLRSRGTLSQRILRFPVALGLVKPAR